METAAACWASTVALPVIGYLAARDRMARPLERLRGWLEQNNATVMAVLLLVIGVVAIVSMVFHVGPFG